MRSPCSRLPARGHRGRAGTVFALAVVALSACSSGTEPGEDGGPPIPGNVTYQLVSPYGREGALLVRLPADEVISVGEGGDILTDVVTRVVGDEIFIAVLHRFGLEGLGFEVQVTDSEDPPTPVVVQVVGPDDRDRPLTGYAVAIR